MQHSTTRIQNVPISDSCCFHPGYGDGHQNPNRGLYVFLATIIKRCEINLINIILGENGPLPREVRVPLCHNKLPCTVFAGEPVSGEVDFAACAAGDKTLRTVVFVTIAGERKQLELPAAQSNACNYLSEASCPLAPGQLATFNFEHTVKGGVSGPASIEVSLVNENNKVVVCGILNVIVKK